MLNKSPTLFTGNIAGQLSLSHYYLLFDIYYIKTDVVTLIHYAEGTYCSIFNTFIKFCQKVKKYYTLGTLNMATYILFFNIMYNVCCIEIILLNHN